MSYHSFYLQETVHERNLKRHMDEVHNDGSQVVKCPSCGTKITRLRSSKLITNIRCLQMMTRTICDHIISLCSLLCVLNHRFLARRNLGRHYSNTIGHPRSYSAVATYSLPYDPANGEPDADDLKRQLQHNLGYPEGVRYGIFFILNGHILQPMTYW